MCVQISSELSSHPVVRVLDRLEECPRYYPSYEERVALDVAMVVCTMLEMCCTKQLRAATPTSPSSVQRIACIRKLVATGQLCIPRCVVCVVCVSVLYETCI